MSKEKKLFILETAVRMFAEKSYDVVTIRELSSAAGVNDATLYHYFKSKEGILDEVIAQFIRKLKSRMATYEQIDAYLETDAPAQLLERLALQWNPEDAKPVLYLCRIVCMEQFTYRPAKHAAAELLYREPAKRVKYALDKLIERKKVPALDTQAFSALWADVMLARLVMSISDFSQASDSFSPGIFTGPAQYLASLALTA